MTSFLKKIIKEKRKSKELVELYCRTCKMGIKKMYIPIRAKAVRKEFLRQHNHKLGIMKRIINKLKGIK